ncbi:hypothetical protein [Micromonospora eburnea]|uniref:hypothetical protein n=1 Tax=Micromonospora eburnea TaxID=227316 RepID=UPI001ABFAA1F|nr:hypothetical protein [Micromonospora eburnea]
MTDAQPLDPPNPLTATARATIDECDTKLERYRAALDAGADPAVVTTWITETQAQRAQAEADLKATQTPTSHRLNQTEIAAMVHALGNITTALGDADPADKAAIYEQLGLRLTYDPETQTVRAEANLSAHRGVMGCVRGGT